MSNIFKKRVPLLPVMILFAVYTALFAFAVFQIDQLTTRNVLNGLYQTEYFSAGPVSTYNAQFYGDQFYIDRVERDGEGGSAELRLLSGTFSRIPDGQNAYLLHDADSDSSSVLVLEPEGFCFYDAERDVSVFLQLRIPLSP